MLRSGFKVFTAVLVFGGIHSLIASRLAKETAARAFNRRNRNAFYRVFYTAQSFFTLAVLLAYIWPLPDRTIYKIRGPLALLMRLGQIAGLGYAFWTAVEVGLARISGLTNLLAWLKGERRIPSEPEAQGPSPLGDQMKVSGPFRFHRHPLNFSPLVIFWLNPVMTVKLLALNLASSLYLYLGSFHEEQRLRASYGNRYIEYQKSGIPFFWPKS